MTMHGAPRRLDYQDGLRQRRPRATARSRGATFHGVGGEAKSDTVYNMPAGIGGQLFAIEPAELPRGKPPPLCPGARGRLGAGTDRVPNWVAGVRGMPPV